MSLTQLFSDIDDFCQGFTPEWKKNLLEQGVKKRNRPRALSQSEIITIVIHFHQSGYRIFKWYYQKYVCKILKNAFPKLLSYNRFIELIPEVLVPVSCFMQSRCRQGNGIAFIDSTPLRVCKNLRIPRHKTFANEAERGKYSTGWFYGFKLHLLVDDCGEILSFQVTRGNVDDRKPVPT
jgi:hypothetical protein